MTFEAIKTACRKRSLLGRVRAWFIKIDDPNRDVALLTSSLGTTIASIRDKGQCGSCWAFAVNEVFPSAVVRKTYILYD
jgi:hypothetical protein